MGKEWAKVYRDCKDSDRLTALLAKNGFAEAIYWRLKAHADDFGRYYGDADAIAEGVCPRNIIRGHFRLKKLEQAIADMADCGLVTFYEVGGRKYLELVDYNTHAHDKWANIGRPEYPAPPGWTPSEELVEWIVETRRNPKATNCTAERFGITRENWPVGIEYPWPSEHIPTGVPTPEGTPLPTGVGTGTDVDVDVQTQTTADGDGDAPAGATAPPPVSTSGFGMKRPGAPMVLSNYCRLSSAVQSVYFDHWGQAKCNDFTVDAAWGLDNPGCTVTEQEAVDALASPDGLPAVNQRGDWWIEQLDKAKRKTRASPPQHLGTAPQDRSKFHEGPLDEIA